MMLAQPNRQPTRSNTKQQRRHRNLPFCPIEVTCTVHGGDQHSQDEWILTVDSVLDRTHVWKCGAFGKGNLSRSEPTWFNRHQQLISLDSAALTTGNSEFVELVSLFRKLGRPYKPYYEDHDDLHTELIDVIKANARQLFAGSQSSDSIGITTERNETEYVILIHEEYIWSLLYAPKALVRANLQYDMSIYMYLAYVYFRDKNWVVRQGYKFGVDYLLYTTGPQFSHSKYAVIVLPGESCSLPDRAWLKIVQRVVNHAKKKLILCYVTIPIPNRSCSLITWAKNIFLGSARSNPSNCHHPFPSGRLHSNGHNVSRWKCPLEFSGVKVQFIEVNRFNLGKNR